MRRLPYNTYLKQFSRDLRNHSTLGEVLLWKRLRAGSIRGYPFNRQKPLGNYIVDFYRQPLHLVIEVDGGYHFRPEQIIKDKQRQSILESLGLNFLRFLDADVRENMDAVLQQLTAYIDAYETGHPEARKARFRHKAV